MTSLASERSWLLDPSVLKLVHQCRRLIQTEFGVKLHLTDGHLEQQLAEYAGKTRSSHLIRIWETLKQQVPQLNIEPDTDDDGLKRTYRGQVIADAPAASSAPEANEAFHPPRKTKVIYRGQVVG